MTQAQLGRAVGLTKRTIVNIEGGKHRPSVSSRVKFSTLAQKHEREKHDDDLRI